MTTEEAGVGSTVSSACTSCGGTPGHNGHAGIEALSRVRENAWFAARDAENCKKLREQMAAEKAAACTCEPKTKSES